MRFHNAVGYGSGMPDRVSPKEEAIATTERKRGLENLAEGGVVARKEQERD